MLASCGGDGPLQGGGEVSVARPPSRPALVPAETLLLALNLRGRAGFFLIQMLRARALSLAFTQGGAEREVHPAWRRTLARSYSW